MGDGALVQFQGADRDVRVAIYDHRHQARNGASGGGERCGGGPGNQQPGETRSPAPARRDAVAGLPVPSERRSDPRDMRLARAWHGALKGEVTLRRLVHLRDPVLR